MVDFNALLAQKYAILGQQADADTMRARASANYDNARAGVVGTQQANENALAKANVGHLGAQTGYLGAQTAEQISQTAAADSYGRGNIFDRATGARPPMGGGMGGMLSPTPIASQPTVTSPPSNFTNNAPFSGAPKPPSTTPNNGDWSQTNAASPGAGVKSVQPTYKSKEGEGGGISMSSFKKGTARVPGKGSPKKDTVPAKLAPGEAVLNAPAAEMAGRGNIAALNRRGAQQMGMVPGKGNMPGHYACGTSNVQHYATGTEFVRSNDQRDLLPPVVGPVMSAPNSPYSNLPLVVGPVMSAGPSPLPPVVGPVMSAPPMQPGDAASMNVHSMLAAPDQPMAPPPAPAPAGWGLRAAVAAPPMSMPEPDAFIPQPPIMQPEGPRGMRVNLGAERARQPSAFEEAFAAARKAQGANSTFQFKGGSYTTNYASEPFKRQPRRA